MKKNIVTALFAAIALSFSFSGHAQKKTDYVYLTGTKFTYPLIAEWVAEYTKIHPSTHIKILQGKQTSDSASIRIVAHSLAKGELKPGEEIIPVSRFALLPITNERNVEPKKAYKKGLSQDELKQLFFTDPLSALDNEEKTQPKLTVYTRNNQACSSIAFANHFKQGSATIKGKKVSGDDQFLTVAIQKDSTGITYNNLGYIYDLSKRVPISGIKIIPIDLNENGKIDKEELIYDNLDKLTAYLESNLQNKTIPEDNVSFIIDKNKDNATISEFVKWVLTNGQQYAHQFGFLLNSKSSKDDSQISQNIQP